MNHERMLAVADRIEADADHFNMIDWYRSKVDLHNLFPTTVAPPLRAAVRDRRFACTTVACVAGHAVLLYGDPDEVSRDSISSDAAEILDLTHDETDHLFFFSAGHDNKRDVTAAEAAAEIRRMVAADRAGQPTVPSFEDEISVEVD